MLLSVKSRFFRFNPSYPLFFHSFTTSETGYYLFIFPFGVRSKCASIIILLGISHDRNSL